MITELIAALVAPENRADPYSIYTGIRALGVVSLPDAPVTFVSSFAGCETVLRSGSFSAARSERTSGGGRASILAAAGAQPPRSMQGLPITLLDPPEHTRQRGLVSRSFTPSVVATLRPTIMGFVDDSIDAMAPALAAGEPVDLVSRFALPLPFNVICRLLGFPSTDIASLSDWSGQLLRAIDPMLAIVGNHGEPAKAAAAIMKLHDYVSRVVDERQESPGPDLLTAMLRTEGIDRDLVVRFSVVLLVSGYETLVNSITNGALALLRHPRHLEELRARPARAARVADEILRFDPPVQLIVRTAKESLTLEGRPVEAGATVVAFLAAANRDPAKFRDPDAFDPDRAETDHLSFGVGSHYCLGAVLARLEVILALARLVQRVDGLRLVDRPLHYNAGLTIRGLRDLPVSARAVKPRATPWPTALEDLSPKG